MDDRIKEHLKRLHRDLLMLGDLRNTPLEKFKEDFVTLAASERYLQMAIESCLNIGNRLLALVQMEQPVTTPETYADIFKELDRLGVWEDHDLTERLIQMARFRNRLVHIYWDIDEETVYRILHESLSDLERFKQAIIEYEKTSPVGTPPCPCVPFPAPHTWFRRHSEHPAGEADNGSPSFIHRTVLEELPRYPPRGDRLSDRTPPAGKTTIMQNLKQELDAAGEKALFLSLDFDEDRVFFDSHPTLL